MADILEVGSVAPDFTLESDTEGAVTLSSYKGKKNVVLYFYPKDSTSGCTKEACDFRDNLNRLTSDDTVVLGVSKDSLKSHANFRAKQGLTFPLLSDPEGKVCDMYGVWKEKSMYGRKYFGIERSTFLINKEGKIVQLWRKVSVPGHVNVVIEALKAL